MGKIYGHRHLKSKSEIYFWVPRNEDKLLKTPDSKQLENVSSTTN